MTIGKPVDNQPISENCETLSAPPEGAAEGTEVAIPEDYSPAAFDDTDSPTPGEMQQGVNALSQGIGGLLFALSLIFLLGSPLISAGIFLLLLMVYGGKTAYEIRQ